MLFEKVIGNENRNFSRYNYFLVNYLLSKNEHIAAKLFIHEYGESHDSPLLIRQTHHFIKKNKIKKITNFFNCKKPKDSMAEIFYVIANMYSTQKNYQMSNFYLNISLYLNDKFKPNIILLAENYYFQNKFELSKKTYNSAKSIGSIYSWFASKSISTIIRETENKRNSISYLKKAFDSLKNLNFNHYYELANYSDSPIRTLANREISVNFSITWAVQISFHRLWCPIKIFLHSYHPSFPYPLLIFIGTS